MVVRFVCQNEHAMYTYGQYKNIYLPHTISLKAVIQQVDV